MKVKKQCNFFQDVTNKAKMGAYYTDLDHCRSIASFLEFPDGEEVCALEPSIGNGEAVLEVVQKKENVRIYGCELNAIAGEKLKGQAFEEICIADFLEGMTITKSSFSFCFGNPPYLEDLTGERQEKRFLEKVSGLMKKEGIIVWVINYSTFSDRSHMRFFYNRFQFLHVFRFRTKEYAKFQQVAVIGRKRPANKNILKEELNAVMERYDEPEKIPELPFRNEGEKVKIPPSWGKDIMVFAPMVFPRDDALAYLKGGAGGQLKDISSVMGKEISQKEYDSVIKGHPPIPLSKDSAYLVSVCGASSGLCGSEEEGTRHLKRGVVRMIDSSSVSEKPGGREEEGIETVTRSAQILFTVCQQDGTISQLV